MQRLMILAVLGAMVACTAQKRAEVQVDLSKSLSPGCYTVDLFDPYRIEYPAADVPEDVRKFLGVWKNGAWGGRTCHDLYITKAYADGRVEVIDAYGPNTSAGREATVFKRTGMVKDGVLTFFSRGQAEVQYRVQGDYLLGQRVEKLGKFEITMSREDGIAQVPIPPVKPVRQS